MQQGQLVIIRHGESTWNLENRFTGWVDVDLTAKGIEQAYNAGLLLKKHGFSFDIAYTSVLKRAIKTLFNVLDAMDLLWIQTVNAWELNERHYGGLTGLDKAETAKLHGDEQLKIWRRSYDICPPDLSEESEYHPKHDKRYQGLDSNKLPSTECLKDTLERVVPYWENVIYPQIKAGKNVVIAAHGNSLRALIKHLGKMSESEILELNLANGEPIVYNFAGYDATDANCALNYSILK
ncbi:MAG: 2,3-bisphosphoglycerate-dependent phosphoglycerate mutase [Pseudomonadota bacterium]|jgi:2,3-bisphosphoglycerate-dependent phosphoglycerate mutase